MMTAPMNISFIGAVVIITRSSGMGCKMSDVRTKK